MLVEQLPNCISILVDVDIHLHGVSPQNRRRIPQRPQGRIPDKPPPAAQPGHQAGQCWSANVPIDFLRQKNDAVHAFFLNVVRGVHLMGGSDTTRPPPSTRCKELPASKPAPCKPTSSLCFSSSTTIQRLAPGFPEAPSQPHLDWHRWSAEDELVAMPSCQPSRLLMASACRRRCGARPCWNACSG